MNRITVWLFWLLVPGALSAQDRSLEAVAQQKFASGGTIRLHLESGGYTISPTDSNQIVVTYRANSESQLKRVKVAIKPALSSADIYVIDTPSSNFEATIEVPRESNLWARLTAGELDVEDIKGDKNLELWAGRIHIEIPHPEEYGHRDASVTTGSIESSAFDISKGGLLRSFEQHGSGKYRLHAHVLTGEIDLTGTE